MRRHYYIETDGEVYLVRGDDGTLRFPTDTRDLGFPTRERFRFQALPGEEVVVADPELPAHPTDWFYKDSIPERDDVDLVVRKAINVSLPRCVVSLAVLRDATTNNDPAAPPETLMVQASRGMTEGMWNIPGGFIAFNEHPEDAARREGAEELGTSIRLGRLIGIYSEFFDKPGHAHHLYCFGYEAKLDAHDIEIDRDEIAAYRWAPLPEAITSTHNPFAKRIWSALLETHDRRIHDDHGADAR